MTRPPRRRWDRIAVLAANDEWAWVPEEARSVRTDEYLVVAYPDYVTAHTGARVFGSQREAPELVDEVHSVARGFGRDQVWWVVSDATQPSTVGAELLGRGGTVVNRLDVLALVLATGDTPTLPDLAVPRDITVRRVVDEAGLRDALEVEAAAFDWPAATDAQVIDGLTEIARGARDDSIGRAVAYLGNRPAGVGGWGLVDGVCRLWGGATHPDARGRGAYRAVLAERLRIAARHGVTLGLTHGRVETSSPILQRVGFLRYGEQRQIVVDL